MSENFGLEIGLEGEKEFKKSLAEINNSFKVLGSEMKLVDSQFDKNDKSAEALTARNQVLNKEIEQQKQKIDTLRTALQNAAESFGENDRRTQSWQIQLNNAQAALNGMERELNSNNVALANADKGFDEAGDEAKNFSGAVKKAADTSEDADGKLGKLGDTAKKIGAALGAAAAAVGTACVAAGKKLWDMANDVGSAGDQIDKTSQKIGISAESYQKWGYVFERCGADVDNLQSGMKKLSTVITDAANGSDSATEKLSAVGLSIEDLNGKSQDEQLSMVITALQGMESGAERTAAANDLLGKSATDMAAVLNITAEETERLKQEAEDYGMVMSNETVAASAAFEDSLTRLSHTAGGLKNRMVGELLPGITQITDGLSDLLAGNDNAADELKNGVSSVIDAIKTLIPQAAKLVSSIAGAVLESAPGIIKLHYIDEANGYIADAYFMSYYMKTAREYKDMPYSTCSQIVIQNLCRDWKAYYKSYKEFRKNSNKFLGMPSIPHYYDTETGRDWLVLTSQNFKVLSTGDIKLPAFLNGLYLKTKHTDARQLRIKTTANSIVINIIYQVADTEMKADNGKYRGLFVSNKGISINADVNGAYQILKKRYVTSYKGMESTERLNVA